MKLRSLFLQFLASAFLVLTFSGVTIASSFDALTNKYDEIMLPHLFALNKNFSDVGNIPYGGRHVDFREDCGLVDINYRLTESAAKTQARIENYFVILKARNMLNDEVKKKFSEIYYINEVIKEKIKSNLSLDNKKTDALPMFLAFEIKSSELARLVGFNYDGGCGAAAEDSQEVTFDVDPSAKEVKFISKFHLKFCKSIGADPLDFNECDAWEDVIKDDAYELSGDYFVYAKWSDGTTKESMFSVTSKKAARIRVFK